jgi:hypothetical protein
MITPFKSISKRQKRSPNNWQEKTMQIQALVTHDMTLMSDRTSVTIVGQRICHLTNEVHLSFALKQPQSLDDCLGQTESLCLVMSDEDARLLGRLLLDLATTED